MTDSVLGKREKKYQEKPFPLCLPEGEGVLSDGSVRQEMIGEGESIVAWLLKIKTVVY